MQNKYIFYIIKYICVYVYKYIFKKKYLTKSNTFNEKNAQQTDIKKISE